MAGGVEQVDDALFVGELEDGGADGDAPLPLHGHPVGGGTALVFAGADASGKVDGVAVEQEFFGEGGFACVGVGDNGEGASVGVGFGLHGFRFRYFFRAKWANYSQTLYSPLFLGLCQCFLHQSDDFLFFGGGQVYQCERSRPHIALVQARVFVEAKRRVARVEF
jgi:hypothetical protein